MHIASDRHCRQGDNRGHRRRHLGQVRLQVFYVLACAGQPDHQHECQVPQKEESMGAPRSHA